MGRDLTADRARGCGATFTVGLRRAVDAAGVRTARRTPDAGPGDGRRAGVERRSGEDRRHDSDNVVDAERAEAVARTDGGGRPYEDSAAAAHARQAAPPPRRDCTFHPPTRGAWQRPRAARFPPLS